MDDPSEKAADIQPTIRPTEYRCYIKEVFLYATAGAETPSWTCTFVHRTLPVPVALDARLPTLFVHIIHEAAGKVNRNCHILETHFKIYLSTRSGIDLTLSMGNGKIK